MDVYDITSRPSLKTKTSKSSLVKNLYPNSSLVRRARLIRRSTTNQYCEHLKRLKEEDGVVIHQILIIRLKSREDASDYEKACIRGSNSAFVPSVEFAYPPVGNEACKFPPPLFYPDFTKSTVQRKEDLESFPVILTNEKGDRTYAYCFKFLSKPKSPDLSPDGSGSYSVLVFASHYSQEALFNQLAADFVATIQKDTTKLYTMCRDLLNLRLTTSEDAYKRSKYIVNKDLKWSKCAVSTSIEKIGLENAVFIFLCLLAEKRVIVTGSNISDVSRTVQMFVRLLAPLEWPHTLIPIIPDSQSELCYNPTPYICGILRYNLSRVKDLICPLPGDTSDEITIIDVERGIVLPCLPLQILRDNELRVKALVNCGDAMGFPKSAISDLLGSLRSVFPVKNFAKADFKIEEKIMTWYAKLFGHYQQFGSGLMSAKNRKLFVKAHPSPDTREFLQWFVETGILQTFFHAHDDPKLTHPLDGRFQKICKKYAPPVGKTGKRKKARSIVWRLFTH